jgi:hypothetical protein
LGTARIAALPRFRFGMGLTQFSPHEFRVLIASHTVIQIAGLQARDDPPQDLAPSVVATMAQAENGTVHFDDEHKRWVAIVNWDSLRHQSDSR